MYMVTFGEFAYGEMLLIARFWLMKSRLNGSDNDMKYKDHKQHSNGFPNNIKHQRNSFIQIWYTTLSKWKPNTWKLVIQQHGNASLSQWSLLDLEIRRIWLFNYILVHNLCISHHHKTHIKFLIQIWYTTL